MGKNKVLGKYITIESDFDSFIELYFISKEVGLSEVDVVLLVAMDAAFSDELQLKSIFCLFLAPHYNLAQSCDHFWYNHDLLGLSFVGYRHCPLNIFPDYLFCSRF